MIHCSLCHSLLKYKRTVGHNYRLDPVWLAGLNQVRKVDQIFIHWTETKSLSCCSGLYSDMFRISLYLSVFRFSLPSVFSWWLMLQQQTNMLYLCYGKLEPKGSFEIYDWKYKREKASGYPLDESSGCVKKHFWAQTWISKHKNFFLLVVLVDSCTFFPVGNTR